MSDAHLRALGTEKVDWEALAPAARRDYLNRLSDPPQAYAGRSHHARRTTRS